MKVAFAHNVFDRFKTLKETINIEKSFFPESQINVACNSYKNDEFFNQISNVNINYYFETPQHKIGCVNGLILSCNMALEKEFDVLIFSHDDVRIVPKYIDVIMNHINNLFLNNFDIIYRNPEWIATDYAMMEVVFMNRKAVEKLFSNIKLLKIESEIGFYGDSISPEFWFYNIIKNRDLKPNVIRYKNDIEISEQMGYEHLNVGLRGWKD